LRSENFSDFCLSENLSCGISAVQGDSDAEILLLDRFFFSEVIVRLRRRSAEGGQKEVSVSVEKFLCGQKRPPCQVQNTRKEIAPAISHKRFLFCI
jgi:hypothetical protein